MDLNIPTVCVAMFGMFVMGFGVAKGIYMDSKPFRTRDQINTLVANSEAISKRGK